MEFELLTIYNDNIDIGTYLSSKPSTHYKVYKIPKRQLGFRLIAQPTPKLKDIQREVIYFLNQRCEIQESATAYIQGKSIKDNAEVHRKSDYLLKLDLENFFNSITPKLLFKALKSQGVSFNDKDEKALSELLFWNRSKRKNGKLVLSVGAPCSPFISNLIMGDFDKYIVEQCSRVRVSYTRYADDLTFSTTRRNELFAFVEIVNKALKKFFGKGLSLNLSKTVFSSKAHNRHITGITLTNDNKLSIGRNKRRYISALVHKFKHDLLVEDDIYHLKGLLAFAEHIERGFIGRLIKKYGEDVVQRLIGFNRENKNV